MKKVNENSSFPKTTRLLFLKKSLLALGAVFFPEACKKDEVPTPVYKKPAYQSSEVDNNSPSLLEMIYDLTLANIVPPVSAFTVTVNSVVRDVSNVVISGNMVLLTLSSPIVYGDIVTVAYTRPSVNFLQTDERGQASGISIQNVTNNVNLQQVTPIPVYKSSLIDNNTPSVLEMTYDLTLANIVPPISSFTVKVNSVARNVSNIVISGAKVLLTLSIPVAYGDIVTVVYTKPSTNSLRTDEGGEASSIGIQSVTNNVQPPLANLTKVYLVKNGTVQQNITKLLELVGGISKYIDPTDVVVLKCNGQWPNQGYTNSECIKYVIDAILEIPVFSGEVLICDNIQNVSYDTSRGFLASPENRVHNWADHNWSTLAEEYQANSKPVAIFPWLNADTDTQISGPADGSGWVRDFFPFRGMTLYLSYPIFESPITSGRMIDMKNGIWEAGAYTGRRVRTIFMPTLNNHGTGSEDYAGVTSAIKCFFGATEILIGGNDTITHDGQTCYNIHSASYTQGNAYYAGELAARYINTLYSPVLYITCAIWSGNYSRSGVATETKTVLACENPATLDYVSCKHVISRYASWLDPDNDNNTRKQIMGCVDNKIGTIDSDKYEVISFDFG